MIIRKGSNGSLYVCRKKSKGNQITNYRDWWFVKYCGHVKQKCGVIVLGTVTIPRELVGKRIRFKVEVIDDGEKI